VVVNLCTIVLTISQTVPNFGRGVSKMPDHIEGCANFAKIFVE